MIPAPARRSGAQRCWSVIYAPGLSGTLPGPGTEIDGVVIESVAVRRGLGAISRRPHTRQPRRRSPPWSSPRRRARARRRRRPSGIPGDRPWEGRRGHAAAGSGPAPSWRAGGRRGRRPGAVAAAIALGGGSGESSGDGVGEDGSGEGRAADAGAPAAHSTAAELPESNLTANPSFESDLFDWEPFNSDIERVDSPDAPDGSAVAQASLTAAQTEYAIDDSPDSVDASTQGQHAQRGSPG